MSTATDIQVTITTPDDCTWTSKWQWAYAGDEPLSDVREELEITDVYGTLIDIQREEAHAVVPGEIYSGGGPGPRLLVRGNCYWTLRVLQGDNCLGSASGSFWAGRY